MGPSTRSEVEEAYSVRAQLMKLSNPGCESTNFVVPNLRRPCLWSGLGVLPRGADGCTWLALADAEYLGPADSTNTLSCWFTVFQRHLFRVLDLPFGTALEAIGIHSLSSSSVYFDSEDTRYRQLCQLKRKKFPIRKLQPIVVCEALSPIALTKVNGSVVVASTPLPQPGISTH